ncbi:MAG: hypothetical protein ABJZ55_21235 [Fuerstiella sp.]
MNKTRKTIVATMFGVLLLTTMTGCTTTGSHANHPFTTMFQGYDPIALNSPETSPFVANETQRTATAEESREQERL